MPSHDVSLNLHTKVVAHKNIEVKVRSYGSALGTLLISKGNKYRLSREEFSEVMLSEGRWVRK